MNTTNTLTIRDIINALRKAKKVQPATVDFLSYLEDYDNETKVTDIYAIVQDGADELLPVYQESIIKEFTDNYLQIENSLSIMGVSLSECFRDKDTIDGFITAIWYWYFDQIMTDLQNVEIL